MESTDPNHADAKLVLDVPTDQLRPDQNQPRKSFVEQELEDLGDSMLRRKQLHPLLIRQDGSHYIILDGERRWRAAKLKGIPKLQAVLATSEDEAVRALLQVTANGHRANLNPLELAQSYRQIMDRTGLNATQLAEELSVSKSQVSNMLSLLTLPSEAQQMVRTGELGLVKAAAISRLDPNEQSTSIARAKQGKLTRDEVLGPRKRSPAPGPKRKRVTLELGSGKAVVSMAEKISLLELVDFLQALARECRKAIGQGLDIQTLVCLLHDRAQQAMTKANQKSTSETPKQGEHSC